MLYFCCTSYVRVILKDVDERMCRKMFKLKRKPSLVLVIALSFAAVLAAGGCGGSSDGAKEAGDVEEYAVESLITSSDWTARDETISNDITAKINSGSGEGWGWVLKRLGEMEAVAHIGNYSNGGISSIKMKYWTKNAMGMLVQADAAVFIPHALVSSYKAPIIAIQHPTEVLRKNSPSKMVKYKWYDMTDSAQAQMHLAALIARCGYIVVLPDYLGMGDNVDVHPYCQELLADSVMDAVDATIDVAANLKKQSTLPPAVWDEKKIMLMGFSEGGYATMITAKKMQARNDKPVTAVAALDGPYSLSGTMRDVMLTADENFSSPYFMPYVLNAYDAAYGSTIPELKFSYSVRNDVSGYNDYPATLQKYMDGEHTYIQINDLMRKPFEPDNYKGPSTILSAGFLELLENQYSVVCETMEDNNSFIDWKPEMPLKMFHHVSDDLVPIGNMNEAEAAFKSAGSNKIETESFDGYTAGVGTSMHEKAFLVAFFKGIYWLDYYGYGGRFIFQD